MATYLLTDSGDLPLTIEEVRSHLRIRHTREDALLDTYLKSAVGRGERYTSRAFRTQSWTAMADSFADCELRQCPVTNVSQLSYRNTENIWTIVDSAVYYLHQTHQWSYIFLRSDQVWPSDLLVGELSRVLIEFQVDPASQDYLEEAKLGLLNHVAFMFENRGDHQTKESAIDASGAANHYDTFRIARV